MTRSNRIGLHEGVFLPHTAFYWFRAVGDEPLVMLRVGATSNPEGDVLERLGIDGKSMDGFSDANKEVEVVFGPDMFG